MQKGLVLLMFCCIAITQLISSIFLHCTCILIYPICQSSSQSLKIKRKLQKNVWGSCWASWLICTAQWQLDYTALLKPSQMSKKLKQTIFLNMMTFIEMILGVEGGPPIRSGIEKVAGNSSNVCYRRVSTKAKASTVYCFLREPGKQNRKETICEARSWWKNYYLQSCFTCPALLSVCLTSRVLVKTKAKMGTVCYMTQAKGRTDPQDRQTCAFLLGYEWCCSPIAQCHYSKQTL